MGSVPYALSIQHFVSSVGADAGFAAIIGLAILVLLYFAHASEAAALRQQATMLADNLLAHARETAALREQVKMLDDRLKDAKARLAEVERPAIPMMASRGTPAAAQTHGHPADPATARSAATPGPPAGVAAPALASATRFVHASADSAVPATQTAPARRGQPALAGQRALAPAAAPAPQPFAPQTDTVAAAGAASGVSHTLPRPVPEQATRTAAGGRASIPPRPDGSPRSERSRFAPLAPPSRKRKYRRRVFSTLVGIIVLGGVAAALLVAASNSGTQNRPASGRPTNAPSSKRYAAPKFNPATVTVAVLNGTSVNKLADHIAARLVSQGYKTLPPANAGDQTVTTTTVSYLPDYRTDAMHVATALGLGASAVRPIDPSARQVLCQGATACAANLVVTVGANLANG